MAPERTCIMLKFPSLPYFIHNIFITIKGLNNFQKKYDIIKSFLVFLRPTKYYNNELYRFESFLTKLISNNLSS